MEDNTERSDEAQAEMRSENVEYFCAVLRGELMRCKPHWGILSARLGINRHFLGRFANGQIEYPTVPLFFKLAKALGFRLTVEPSDHFLDAIPDTCVFTGFESFARKKMARRAAMTSTRKKR